MTTAGPTNNPEYETERGQLLAALRHLTDAGVIEHVEHVGSTSVPGLAGSGCVDIALSVWPFPLDAAPQAALAALGYMPADGQTGTSEQRYLHSGGQQRLLVCEAGSDTWMDHLLLRDYLCEAPAARGAYAAMRAAVAAGADEAEAKTRLFGALLPPARAAWVRRNGFGPIERAAAELAGLAVTWCFAGGWALDLHVGRVRRVHHDVDVVIDRTHQLALQAHMLERGWQWTAPSMVGWAPGRSICASRCRDTRPTPIATRPSSTFY